MNPVEVLIRCSASQVILQTVKGVDAMLRRIRSPKEVSSTDENPGHLTCWHVRVSRRIDCRFHHGRIRMGAGPKLDREVLNDVPVFPVVASQKLALGLATAVNGEIS